LKLAIPIDPPTVLDALVPVKHPPPITLNYNKRLTISIKASQ
jgi:hypothetical protein